MNALQSFSDTYNLLEGMAQDRARRQAGNALAGGDYSGASQALLQRGLLDDGLSVQRYQQSQEDRRVQQQTQMDERQRAEAAQRVKYLLGATQALRRLPAEQRQAALQAQVMPMLQGMPGFDEQTLAAVAQSDLSDQTLDAFAQTLGAEAEKSQLFQTRGGDIVRVPVGGIAGVAYDNPEPSVQGEWKAQGGNWWFVEPGKPPVKGPALTAAPRAGGGGRPASAPTMPSAPRSYGSGAEPAW